MSVVRIREGPYYRGFFKKKCMRILSVHGKLSVIERCPHGEVRLYLFLIMYHKDGRCSNNIILNANIFVVITVNFFLNKSANRLLTFTKKKWLVEE